MARGRAKPLPLDQVFKSLGDPVRLSIVRQLVQCGELACGTFEYGVSKATFSHHIRVLEDVGIIEGRPDGTRRMLSLRIDYLKKTYPGLLDLIAALAA